MIYSWALASYLDIYLSAFHADCSLRGLIEMTKEILAKAREFEGIDFDQCYASAEKRGYRSKTTGLYSGFVDNYSEGFADGAISQHTKDLATIERLCKAIDLMEDALSKLHLSEQSAARLGSVDPKTLRQIILQGCLLSEEALGQAREILRGEK